MPVSHKLDIHQLRAGLILCGPILRRVEAHTISVFVALAKPSFVELVVRQSPDPASAVLASHLQFGHPLPATVALGEHLHVATVTLDLSVPGGSMAGFSPGTLYGYDLIFRDAPTATSQETLASLGLLTKEPVLGYVPGHLPGFALPSDALDDVNLFHGSCRKPHGEGADMLAHLDDLIKGAHTDFTVRPHLLLLTGDQIYADDVSKPFLRTLNATAQELLGWNEVYEVTGRLTPALETAIDAATTAIETAATSLDGAIPASGATATMPASGAATLKASLTTVLGRADTVATQLPHDLPDDVEHVPHFIMLHIAHWELDVVRAKIADQRDAIPEQASGNVSIATDVLKDARIFCAGLRAHLIKIASALGDLASDASWGERNVETDSPSERAWYELYDMATDVLAGWRYTLSRIAPPQRAAELKQHAQMSSDAMDAHLMFLGEWYAMYLMVWSDVLWDFDDNGEPKRIATPEEAVPNYGLTGPTSLHSLAADVQTITEFAKGTRKARRVLANVPTLMIFDDHEVTDDWNLNHDWVALVNSSPAGPQLLRNALVAYAIFQDWGNQPDHYLPGNAGHAILQAARAGDASGPQSTRPAMFAAPASGELPALHSVLGLGTEALLAPTNVRKRWDFRYPREPSSAGAFQVLFLDTRTDRGFLDEPGIATLVSNLKVVFREVSEPNPQIGKVAPPALLSADAFAKQLTGRLRDDRVNVVVSPAPVFGLPVIEDVVQAVLAEGQNPETHDQEAWQSSSDAFETLLDTLKGHDVVLLSGDVHYAYSNVIAFKDEDPTSTTEASRIVQLCSSSLKNETALTRGLARFGFSGTMTEVFARFADYEMRLEYTRNLNRTAQEFNELLRLYASDGFFIGDSDLRPGTEGNPDTRSAFGVWWDETASLFDPVGHFLTQKDVSLFSLPRILPLGLLGMGLGIKPVWNFLSEAQGGGEFAKEQFTVYFLSGPGTTEQPEVVGFNNVGSVRMSPDPAGKLSEVTHLLHWQAHDMLNEPTGIPDFTLHATLPRPQLFKRSMARLAGEEVRRWRTNDGAIIRETLSDGSRDPRASALLNLYYRIAGLGEPVWDADNNVIWSAAFISYLVTQAGGADLFVAAIAHIDYIRAAKTNRDNENHSNPFWLFRTTEREPQVGDIVCRSRAATGEIPVTFDNLNQSDPLLPDQFRKTHGDVVVEVHSETDRMVVIGGNLSNTVDTKEYGLVNGKVGEEDYFGLIAIDRHRPATN